LKQIQTLLFDFRVPFVSIDSDTQHHKPNCKQAKNTSTNCSVFYNPLCTSKRLFPLTQPWQVSYWSAAFCTAVSDRTTSSLLQCTCILMDQTVFLRVSVWPVFCRPGCFALLSTERKQVHERSQRPPSLRISADYFEKALTYVQIKTSVFLYTSTFSHIFPKFNQNKFAIIKNCLHRNGRLVKRVKYIKNKWPN